MEVLKEYNSLNYIKEFVFPCYMKNKNTILMLKDKNDFLNKKNTIKKKRIIKIQTNFK